MYLYVFVSPSSADAGGVGELDAWRDVVDRARRFRSRGRVVPASLTFTVTSSRWGRRLGSGSGRNRAGRRNRVRAGDEVAVRPHFDNRRPKSPSSPGSEIEKPYVGRGRRLSTWLGAAVRRRRGDIVDREREGHLASSPAVPSLAVMVTVCESSGPSVVSNDQSQVPSRFLITVPTVALTVTVSPSTSP